MKIAIVYCSPAGTTRHVAQAIAHKHTELGDSVELIDLGKNSDGSALMPEPADCLYIGSPVYACHAVPPIQKWIAALPDGSTQYAVPFVTWGAVSSGIALYEMGKALTEKGSVLLGAAKMVAVHSLMWQCRQPLGEGRPGPEDDQMIADLAAAVSKKLRGKTPDPVSLTTLAYQPQAAHEAMEKLSIEVARTMLPPRQVDSGLCTRCGICAAECPARAITCDPYPVFGRECFLCYMCLRLCPEKAITADFSMMEGFLKKRAAESGEEPVSQIFL